MINSGWLTDCPSMLWWLIDRYLMVIRWSINGQLMAQWWPVHDWAYVILLHCGLLWGMMINNEMCIPKIWTYPACHGYWTRQSCERLSVSWGEHLMASDLRCWLASNRAASWLYQSPTQLHEQMVVTQVRFQPNLEWHPNTLVTHW